MLHLKVIIMPLLAAGAATLLAACADPARRGPDTPGRGVHQTIPTSLLLRKPGGFYSDDGPDGAPPVNLDRVADAQPRVEALNAAANEPYSVFGRDYVPLRPGTPYKRQGTVSWYGRKFHGQRTASGEIYDMYAMTAAHPTLPILSYARVLNLETQRSVIVRINDRGPYSSGRLMDVSYAAAHRLGFAESALATVEVEAIYTGPAPEIAALVPKPVTPPALAQAASPVPDEPPASLPVASDRRGIFLQLGAFGARANAGNLTTRIQREFGDADWMKAGIGIELRGSLHRVQIGPYASRAEANAAVEKIREAVEIRPVVVVK
ncbi:MAG: septal ring lytic transglycosylase RlpA family protein [Betaproteobacteria bacterium]|nr:septal ring lytic transglycosylase RlpA family protein [Betaproteobacteria bacterium]